MSEFTMGNAGEGNTGYRNIGNYNTAMCNVGNRNTGQYNVGNENTGCYNFGNSNTGNFNVGNFNVGDWNISDNNIGCFNTKNHSDLMFFDKPSDLTVDRWRDSWACQLLTMHFRPVESIFWTDMTDEEREISPESKQADYFLRRVTTEKSQQFWKELPLKNKKAIISIPNFDIEKFYQITGVSVI
ncbi:MAG: hypothetical protein LBS29_04395 [Endomicrobium sp.]|jgi:hypothetical protein|nr:hypothetical protein [Endomicrobium sp.]